MKAGVLAGRRILVMRASGQAGKLSQALLALGAVPVEVPLLEIRPPLSFASLDEALRQLGCYDWLIATSANTVAALRDRAEALGLPLSKPARLKIAAVGRATADALRAAGLEADLLPEKFVAESLVDALRGQVAGRRVFFPRAEQAREVIATGLRAVEAQVDEAVAYRNVLPDGVPERLRSVLDGGIDAALFTSSSSVTHLQVALHEAALPWPMARVKAVSIGPITSATLREAGWEPAAEADPHDLTGLLAALEQLFAY